MTDAAPARLPAAARREEILVAAEEEFATLGPSRGNLEEIAARVGITRPRIMQIFGSKQTLFLEVVDQVYDKVEAAFAAVEASDLVSWGEGYRRLLLEEPSVGPLMLQAFAASADPAVRDHVQRRHLDLQRLIAESTGADPSQVRTFVATGLMMTISTVLDLPDRRADAVWSAWILDLAAENPGAGRP